jgi:transposase-like protein
MAQDQPALQLGELAVGDACAGEAAEARIDAIDRAMLAQHRAHMHAARHAKPVPMLLQKRRPAPPPAEVTGTAPQAREPEKV